MDSVACMSQKENKKKYLEEYRVTLRIFESVFYKSLIRACSFDNSLAASQNARSYVQTIDHRALRICKKRIQKVLMLSPFILINISSLVLSDSYMQHYQQINFYYSTTTLHIFLKQAIPYLIKFFIPSCFNFAT